MLLFLAKVTLKRNQRQIKGCTKVKCGRKGVYIETAAGGVRASETVFYLEGVGVGKHGNENSGR